MDFARDPQEPGGGQRRDGDHDQLHRRLEPQQLAQRDHQQVDAEVSDRRPVIVVIGLEPGRMVEVQLDPVAAHMAEQVDQGWNRGIEQRHRRCEHDERQDKGRFPPRPRADDRVDRQARLNPHGFYDP